MALSGFGLHREIRFLLLLLRRLLVLLVRMELSGSILLRRRVRRLARRLVRDHGRRVHVRHVGGDCDSAMNRGPKAAGRETERRIERRTELLAMAAGCGLGEMEEVQMRRVQESKFPIRR